MKIIPFCIFVFCLVFGIKTSLRMANPEDEVAVIDVTTNELNHSLTTVVYEGGKKAVYPTDWVNDQGVMKGEKFVPPLPCPDTLPASVKMAVVRSDKVTKGRYINHTKLVKPVTLSHCYCGQSFFSKRPKKPGYEKRMIPEKGDGLKTTWKPLYP